MTSRVLFKNIAITIYGTDHRKLYNYQELLLYHVYTGTKRCESGPQETIFNLFYVLFD